MKAALRGGFFCFWNFDGQAQGKPQGSRSPTNSQSVSGTGIDGGSQLYLEIPTEEIGYEQAFEHQFRQLDQLEKINLIDLDEDSKIRVYFQKQENQLAMALRSEKKTAIGEMMVVPDSMERNNNGA